MSGSIWISALIKSTHSGIELKNGNFKLTTYLKLHQEEHIITFLPGVLKVTV
jgi:hypothetical protein